MWKFIRKMFVDIIFITILYIVSYTNHDSNSIFQVQHLTNFFLNTRNSSYDFTQVCLFIIFSFIDKLSIDRLSRLMIIGNGYK
jgi:hypothetical protein